MARLLSLALLSYISVVTLGHNYGQPRMNRPGFYAADPAALEPSSPASIGSNEAGTNPAAPPTQANPEPPTQTNPASLTPQMESGFQPSGASLQRGTKKFVDGVRQGLVHGLEEFLGVPGGQPPQPNKPAGGSSVTYAANVADPSSLSYHAPAPFVYGVPTYGSRQPTQVVGYNPRPAPTIQQTGATRYGNSGSRTTSGGLGGSSTPTRSNSGLYDRYSSQPLGSGANIYGNTAPAQGAAGSYLAQPTVARGPQQPPSVTHWFRQDHSAVIAGRNAPADYQQPQIASASTGVVPQYVDASQQYPTYSYQ